MPGERLTIVIVNDAAHVNGGAAQCAIASACELARRGHDVRFFAAVGPVDPALTAAGVHVVCTEQEDILHNPDRLGAAIQGIWNSEAAEAMRGLLAGLDPGHTVVHLHSWTKAISSSIIPVVLRHGCGLVVTMHDFFLVCPNGGLFNYQSAKCCELKPMSLACISTHCDARSYSHKLWRVARMAVQSKLGQLPRGLRHFISISQFSTDLLAPLLPPNAKIHRVDNPIDVMRRPAVDVKRSPRFVFVGRLAREKGSLLAAEGARLASAQLEFVGDGYLRSDLEAEYPGARVSGWLPQADVAARIGGARALVFSSLWYETLGMVVLEAAAQGVPSIVADTSAARDCVVNGETGLWFRGGDSADLCEKIRAMQDEGFAARLGEAAYRRFWASPPTLASHADSLEACYERILSEETVTALSV